MRAVRRVTGGVLVMMFLLGPPFAALTWMQTWRWPTRAQAKAWATDPLTGGTLLAIVAWLVAVAWLLVAVMLVRRIWHRAGRFIRRLRRLPVPTPVQVTAGSLAGVAALTMPSVVVDPAGIPAVGSDSTDISATRGPAVPGIELPGGGWIPYPTALAVSAVGGLIWLYRRVQYTPGPARLDQHQHDPDLVAMPGAAVAITAAVTADEPDPPTTDLHPGVLEQLPAGVVTLRGPGALAAARGLLTTVVLHAALLPAGTVSVSVTGQVLRELLTRDSPASSVPGLDIQTSTEQSRPAGLLQMVIRRRPSDHAEATAPHAFPSDETVTTVIVGEHPARSTGWLVQSDGSVTGPGCPPRVCVLTAPTAVDLITLVHLAARSVTPTVPAAPPPAPARPPSAPAGRLTLLGGCQLLVHDTPLRLRRTASLQILAYLGVHPDGATTTELVRAVWPGHQPATITKRLHTTLSDLREQLRPMLPEPVLRRDERYLLKPGTIVTDLHPLRQAITRAATALTTEQRHTALETITAGYRGELAAGFAWPWLHTAREALRRDVIDAHLLLAESADPAQAATILRAAAMIDPYNTALHQRAVAALHAAGDHHGATTLHQVHPSPQHP
jgi:DNA-binding SARP family transcriptional activator